MIISIIAYISENACSVFDGKQLNLFYGIFYEFFDKKYYVIAHTF